MIELISVTLDFTPFSHPCILEEERIDRATLGEKHRNQSLGHPFLIRTNSNNRLGHQARILQGRDSSDESPLAVWSHRMSELGQWVGIDVSKRYLDIYLRPSQEIWREPNTAFGIANLIKRLTQYPIELIVLESTGGMERDTLHALSEAGLAVVMVNPKRVRDFAKATGKLAKTDKLDAAVLAHFAEAVRPEVRELATQAAQVLQELITRRQQLVEILSAERNRLSAARTTQARAYIETHIDWLSDRIKELDQQIQAHLQESAQWRSADSTAPKCAWSRQSHCQHLSGDAAGTGSSHTPRNCGARWGGTDEL